jgi:hypothetical protein
MLKIIALFILIWIFIKAVGQVLRLFMGGPSVNQQRGNSNHQTNRQGDIHIDHKPTKGNKGYEGGEYVDYEEVE